MSETDPAKIAIGKALGRIPSGVFVLTAIEAGQSLAMMASWVQQVSFDPPAVCVAIAKERPVRTIVEQTARFALSVIGEHDMPLMKKYARGIPHGIDPFEGVNVKRSSAGMPYLADSLAYLDCQLLEVATLQGDHDLFIARVVEGGILKDGASFIHLRGSGFHY